MECRDSVTFHKLTASRFVNITIGETSDIGFIERTQKIQLKIGRVATLEEKLNKILTSTSEL